MRRFEVKGNKIQGLSVTRSFKKYSHAGEDVTDVLDTDEDRVMLYYTSHGNKSGSALLKQRDYRAGRNRKRK